MKNYKISIHETAYLMGPYLVEEQNVHVGREVMNSFRTLMLRVQTLQLSQGAGDFWQIK